MVYEYYRFHSLSDGWNKPFRKKQTNNFWFRTFQEEEEALLSLCKMQQHFIEMEPQGCFARSSKPTKKERDWSWRESVSFELWLVTRNCPELAEAATLKAFPSKSSRFGLREGEESSIRRLQLLGWRVVVWKRSSRCEGPGRWRSLQLMQNFTRNQSRWRIDVDLVLSVSENWAELNWVKLEPVLYVGVLTCLTAFIRDISVHH